MNSYMLPQGTRCSASPLVVTAVMCRASPAQVSRKAARSHGPCGHGDRPAPATAGSRRPALPGRNRPLPLPAASSAAAPPAARPLVRSASSDGSPGSAGNARPACLGTARRADERDSFDSLGPLPRRRGLWLPALFPKATVARVSKHGHGVEHDCQDQRDIADLRQSGVVHCQSLSLCRGRRRLAPDCPAAAAPSRTSCIISLASSSNSISNPPAASDLVRPPTSTAVPCRSASASAAPLACTALSASAGPLAGTALSASAARACSDENPPAPNEERQDQAGQRYQRGDQRGQLTRIVGDRQAGPLPVAG